MISMFLVIANAANNALLDAFRLKAYHVKHLSNVTLPLGAFWIPKLFL